MRWLQEVRKVGTSADRVAAMTLLLQESAVANLRSLDELLRWTGKRSGARAVAGQVCPKGSPNASCATRPQHKDCLCWP